MEGAAEQSTATLDTFVASRHYKKFLEEKKIESSNTNTLAKLEKALRAADHPTSVYQGVSQITPDVQVEITASIHASVEVFLDKPIVLQNTQGAASQGSSQIAIEEGLPSGRVPICGHTSKVRSLKRKATSSTPLCASQSAHGEDNSTPVAGPSHALPSHQLVQHTKLDAPYNLTVTQTKPGNPIPSMPHFSFRGVGLMPQLQNVDPLPNPHSKDNPLQNLGPVLTSVSVEQMIPAPQLEQSLPVAINATVPSAYSPLSSHPTATAPNDAITSRQLISSQPPPPHSNKIKTGLPLQTSKAVWIPYHWQADATRLTRGWYCRPSYSCYIAQCGWTAKIAGSSTNGFLTLEDEMQYQLDVFEHVKVHLRAVQDKGKPFECPFIPHTSCEQHRSGTRYNDVSGLARHFYARLGFFHLCRKCQASFHRAENRNKHESNCTDMKDEDRFVEEEGRPTKKQRVA
ncbi:hypothetical protein H0H81_006654 [Sphagnurus paluster]|uniref:Uncharacterized protein n=1 Tax=Sphagnurus paluster TaxID=117069 RepID=A0A9P7GS47_9AGAR|nr:hypothetical protein H0H81_006654 [Sphagnurus paluster]